MALFFLPALLHLLLRTRKTVSALADVGKPAE
jgi:hypothetical protein